MKLGRVWDYVMRRKGWFLPMLVVLVLGGLAGGRYLAPVLQASRVDAPRASEPVVPPVASSYNNSLVLKIADSTQPAPSYQLTFTEGFTRATVKIDDSPLKSEAYVRIFDAQGKLVQGEYTTMREQSATPTEPTEPEDTERSEETEEPAAVEYAFAQAPASYTLELAPGDMIEVHAVDAYFYSTLDNSEAEAFRPHGTERYLVTAGGLRKATWSEAEGAKQMYLLLRRKIVDEITTYQAEISAEVLNNRHLDTGRKARIMLGYRQLEATDQELYAEFITHLARGGSPAITYSGATEFLVDDTAPQWLDFVTVQDGEDGKIEKTTVTCDEEVDFSQAGEYTVTFQAIDSDGNTGELAVMITVAAPTEAIEPQPLPPVDDAELEPDHNLSEADPTKPAEPSEPLPPAHDPQLSVSNQAISSTGGGRNLDDPEPVVVAPVPEAEKNVESATSVSAAIEAPTGTASVAKVLETTAADVDAVEDKKSAWTWQNLLWIGLGALLLLGLVRFIFDHYVR